MHCVKISVRNLVEFILRSGDIVASESGLADPDAMQEGTRIHKKLQKRMGSTYLAEVPLDITVPVTYDGVSLEITVEGRADGIFPAKDGSGMTIDEIKGIYRHVSRLKEPVLVHKAQAMCYGYIYAKKNKLKNIGIRMTYCHIPTEEVRIFEERISFRKIENWFLDLVQEYAKWAAWEIKWQEERNRTIRSLRFPFDYREGQQTLVKGVYQSILRKKRLYIEAPTGVGKTISTVFPAVKSIGEGITEKIFYLTAKTITRTVAQESFTLLAAQGMRLKFITLTAKEKICILDKPQCNPQACPRALGHFDRVNDAVYDLLTQEDSISRDMILSYAEKHNVCPFEMSLDVSTWCDAIIGDYNYAFDPTACLKRFFAQETENPYIFLIDEAHNLPDRARAMYSARFCKSSLTDAKRTLGKGKSALKTALTKADKAMREARQACVRLAPRRHAEDAPGEPAQTSLLPEPDAPVFALPEPLYAQDGTVFLQELPAALLTPLRAVQAPLQAWLEDNPEADAHPQMLELYFAVQDLVRAAERYDSHFVTQLTARGSELELQLLCLDPAPFVDASLSTGRSAALFSATLTPPAYYRSVLGCADARAVALESPFPAGNLGLFCLPGISTRYRDRERSVQSVSDALARLAQSRVGNYLAFFPSYAYLRQVQEDFAARYPGISTLVQESGLDDAARAAFLARFEPDPAHTLLGFAVMGGIFGEGVDLAGDRLIGCAIVGVGLPQVNPRQEMLRRYYNAQNGAGFDYAYRYPGMNKVLQAAGRVIRTPEDKGVVLLLDDRFAKPDYQRLFPLHWKHLQYLPGPAALETALADFWSSKPE